MKKEFCLNENGFGVGINKNNSIKMAVLICDYHWIDDHDNDNNKDNTITKIVYKYK